MPSSLAGRPPAAPIALVGLPGSGKSTVGAALAARLQRPFVDLDVEVERAAGRSVSEVFAAEGEPGFRRREAEALAAALGTGAAVVACGGGVVTTAAGRDLLRRRATVVWLDAPDGVLLERLDAGSATRPLLRDDPPSRLAALRAGRQDAYALAQVRVDTTGADVEEVVDRVVDAVAGRRLDPPGWAAAIEVLPGTPRAYPVVVAPGAVARVVDHLPSMSTHVAVVCDAAVAGPARRLAAACRRTGRRATLLRVRGGEPAKTWSGAGRLLERVAALGLERGDCLVAVGGGSVGDLCGFAAATYLRGIAVLQVPTTLLAMVDSGLGGKTGVNLRAGKNLAGAFWQPAAVLCDVDLLHTLPERPYRAALAEVVKYAVAVDASLAAAVDSTLDAVLRRDTEVVADVVRRCCAAKAAVVSEDEREAGRRAILNYGHTVGHALEAETGYSDRLLHGEAVAVGMRVAGRLSVRLSGCDPAVPAWQDEVLRRCGLGAPPADVEVTAVVRRTHSDKKSRQGAVRWVLVESLGVASGGHRVPDDEATAALGEVLGS